MLKAFIVRPTNKRDMSQIIDIGCAEAKKALRIEEHLNVVDIVEKSYGYIVVVEVPEKVRRVQKNEPYQT